MVNAEAIVEEAMRSGLDLVVMASHGHTGLARRTLGGYFLKSCGNCAYHNGVGCLLHLPYAAEAYPGRRCTQFQFRKSRLVMQ